MLMKKLLFLILLIGVMFLQSCTKENTDDHIDDPMESDEVLFVQSELDRMSLSEKVGQMLQAERASITPEEVKTYNIGSILSGGGSHPFAFDDSPDDWADMVSQFQQAALASSSGIPLLYGVDAVHGHNNVYGATIFPHNINLGMAGDAELIRRIGEATAKEVKSTGIHWNFSPAVSVAQDIRWGRTYESFGEDSLIHDRLVGAFIEGLQTHDVIATAKHFIADGGTMNGTDQGDVLQSEAMIRAIHLPPYVKAIEAGVGSIMISFSSINGLKMHGNSYWITDVLKEELGFDGIVLSDWNATFQLPGDFRTQLSTAINAGIDMLMLPTDWKSAHEEIITAVNTGMIDDERIDDAVGRIILIKMRNGLYDNPFDRLDPSTNFGTLEHQLLAREAASKSFVLLKDQDVFPLSKGDDIYITGPGSDHVGVLSGGWTTYWQGNTNAEIGTGSSIKDALVNRLTSSPGTVVDTISGAEIVIVVMNEVPYAEGFGDTSDPSIFGGLSDPANQAAYNEAVAAKALGKTVIGVLSSGRPLILGDVLESFDAFVAIFLPGSEGGEALVDNLYGDAPFRGTLSFSWPASLDYFTLGPSEATILFPLGYGLKVDDE